MAAKPRREFLGYCNGRRNKNDCAEFTRDRARMITVPVERNGALITGHEYDEGWFVVLDFDRNPSLQGELPVSVLPQICQDTMLVRTGGGGIHAYFFTIDRVTATHQHVDPRSPLLKGLDVRGDGALAYTPGNKFDEHPRDYTIINDKEIAQVPAEEFEDLVTSLRLPEIRLRRGFQMILGGEIEIAHVKQPETGKSEHLYWQAFFREVVAQGADPEAYFPLLKARQAEFNVNKTRKQLKGLQHRHKRPTTKMYNELFEPWDLIDASRVKEEKVPWYLDFDAWWATIYGEKIWWVANWGEFVKYGAGVYEVIVEEGIDQIVMDYFDSINMKSSSQVLNYAVRRVKAKYHVMLEDFDAKRDVKNVQNGLLNLTTKELNPHSPDYLSLRQMPLEFTEDPSATPYLDKVRATYPVELFKLERFLQAMIYNDMSNEVKCWIYGASRTGKGTVTNMVRAAWQGNASFAGIESLGDSFGLVPLLNKQLNIDAEMNITYLSSTTMARLKHVVGQDGPLTVNKKNVTQFEYDFNNNFFITVGNQLPRLPGNIDVQAWFRRTWMVNFWKRQKPDPKMKAGILEELGDWFSELVLMPYNPLIPPGESTDDFEQANREQWYYSAYPVIHICQALFRKTTNPNDVLRKDDAVRYVGIRLMEEDYGAMAHDKLKTLVTQAIAPMGIYDRRKKNVQYYYPIEIIDAEIAAMHVQQELEDEEEREEWVQTRL